MPNGHVNQYLRLQVEAIHAQQAALPPILTTDANFPMSFPYFALLLITKDPNNKENSFSDTCISRVILIFCNAG